MNNPLVQAVGTAGSTKIHEVLLGFFDFDDHFLISLD